MSGKTDKTTNFEHRPRFEAMLFNYGSLQHTDFRWDRFEPSGPKTVYQAPPVRRARPLYKPIKDIQTMVDFSQRVPFDLFLKPKEILQEDPRNIPDLHVAFEDLEREEVRRTRPRVILTPEASLDDADPEYLEILLQDKYTSTAHNDYRYHPDKRGRPVVSPLVPMPAPPKPIQLKRLRPHIVSPEWRMDSVTWEGRQLRCYCDPTKEFWIGDKTMKSSSKEKANETTN